jgi:hypothetical protein
MNGAIETVNKNIKNIIQKMIIIYKDLYEMLHFAVYAYCTTIRTSTWATPYFYVYRMEAVMSLKAEISSLKILMESKLEEAN